MSGREKLWSAKTLAEKLEWRVANHRGEWQDFTNGTHYDEGLMVRELEAAAARIRELEAALASPVEPSPQSGGLRERLAEALSEWARALADDREGEANAFRREALTKQAELLEDAAKELRAPSHDFSAWTSVDVLAALSGDWPDGESHDAPADDARFTVTAATLRALASPLSGDVEPEAWRLDVRVGDEWVRARLATGREPDFADVLAHFQSDPETRRAVALYPRASTPLPDSGRDGERLDWLEARGCAAIGRYKNSRREWTEITDPDGVTTWGTGATLREAIDAAMRPQESEDGDE